MESRIAQDIVEEKIENMSEVSEGVKDIKPPTASPKKKKNTKRGPSYAAAVTATGITFAIGQLIGGEEARPRKELDEEKNMVNGYEAYFEHYGVIDVPPGIALCMVLLPYGLRVITTKPAKSKLTRLKEWFRKRIIFKKLTANAP